MKNRVHHVETDVHLTEAAVDALRLHGFSRRQFLKGSGALVVAFSVAEFADRLGIAPERMLAQGGNTPQTLDSWIAVGADGNVTVYTGRAVRSCRTPVSTVNGAEIVTLEGLGTPEKPHPIQRAFIDEQAAQCGFCLNGVILTAKAYLDQNPKATDEQIHQAMSTVLCRCFTHTRMLRAIKRYQGTGT